MKKPFKRLLWTVAVLFGLIIIAAIIFLLDFLTTTKSMTPAETVAKNNSVRCIKDRFVNAYIFKGEKSYLMIDAGLGRKKFRQEMGKLMIMILFLLTVSKSRSSIRQAIYQVLHVKLLERIILYQVIILL
jgi:hypothetical protein